jgi:CYTH domain-containing protein
MVSGLGIGRGAGSCVLRERRFLLNELPPGLLRHHYHVQLKDNYIAGTRLRLRRLRVPATDERRRWLQQKIQLTSGELRRFAFAEIELSAEEYEVFKIFEGDEIRKNRYPYEHEGRQYEIDFFLGPLLGLILAKVRFATDEEMISFRPPAFATLEVSGEEIFAGGRLVHLSADELRSELAKRYGKRDT